MILWKNEGLWEFGVYLFCVVKVKSKKTDQNKTTKTHVASYQVQIIPVRQPLYVQLRKKANKFISSRTGNNFKG